MFWDLINLCQYIYFFASIFSKNGHIPQRVEYQMADIFIDLLNYAAKFLNINGRLVFWFPVSRERLVFNIPQTEINFFKPILTMVSNW